jgi:hypothetical protein
MPRWYVPQPDQRQHQPPGDGQVTSTAWRFPAGRSRGVTVAVDGFFAFVWFGWGLGLLGAGAGILGGTGYSQWIPVWICFGVGAHFFPLATTLGNPALRPLGGLLIAVAAAALIVGLTTAVAPSTITGAGAGLCLLAFGIATLACNRRPAPASSAGAIK